jgi:hypothetical protein
MGKILTIQLAARPKERLTDKRTRLLTPVHGMSFMSERQAGREGSSHRKSFCGPHEEAAEAAGKSAGAEKLVIAVLGTRPFQVRDRRSVLRQRLACSRLHKANFIVTNGGGKSFYVSFPLRLSSRALSNRGGVEPGEMCEVCYVAVLPYASF